METSWRREQDLAGRDFEALAIAGAEAALRALREMLGNEAAFRVPVLKICMPADALSWLGASYSMIAVRQDFQGAASGHVWLIFPDEASVEPIRSVFGDHLAFDSGLELELDVLAEVGNVVLNALMGYIANRLKRTLPMSLPEVCKGHAREFFEQVGLSDDQRLFVISVGNSADASGTRDGLMFVLALGHA